MNFLYVSVLFEADDVLLLPVAHGIESRSLQLLEAQPLCIVLRVETSHWIVVFIDVATILSASFDLLTRSRVLHIELILDSTSHALEDLLHEQVGVGHGRLLEGRLLERLLAFGLSVRMQQVLLFLFVVGAARRVEPETVHLELLQSKHLVGRVLGHLGVNLLHTVGLLHAVRHVQ